MRGDALVAAAGVLFGAAEGGTDLPPWTQTAVHADEKTCRKPSDRRVISPCDCPTKIGSGCSWSCDWECKWRLLSVDANGCELESCFVHGGSQETCASESTGFGGAQSPHGGCAVKPKNQHLIPGDWRMVCGKRVDCPAK